MCLLPFSQLWQLTPKCQWAAVLNKGAQLICWSHLHTRDAHFVAIVELFYTTRKTSVSLTAQHQNQRVFNLSKGKNLQKLLACCIDLPYRSILLQCVLQSPHPVVVKVHFQFSLRKPSYLPHTFYSLNWTQMMVQIMTSTELLSAWFFKTLVSAVSSPLHLSNTAGYWATLVCFFHSYTHHIGNPIYWPWWLNVWNISLGVFFNHQVISKAILCCLSFPSSTGNPTFPLSQVSIMGVLLLVTLR